MQATKTHLLGIIDARFGLAPAVEFAKDWCELVVLVRVEERLSELEVDPEPNALVLRVEKRTRGGAVKARHESEVTGVCDEVEQ